MRAEFDESLVTGNEMIDSQHKELIDKINKLLDSCETSKDKVVSVKTLDYLADYTEFHFGEEEKLQEEITYPGVEKHKEEHEKLRQVVRDLYNMLEEEEAPSAAFVEAVNTNLCMKTVRDCKKKIADKKWHSGKHPVCAFCLDILFYHFISAYSLTSSIITSTDLSMPSAVMCSNGP